MLTFHSVSHNTQSQPGGATFQRKVEKNCVTNFYEPFGEDHRCDFNLFNDKNYECRTLRDFCWMGEDVKKKPLKAWEYAKRFGTEGAIAGAGAGACLALGLGVLCWPLVLAGGAVAGVACGAAQWSVVDDARDFDEAIIELSNLAASGISNDVNTDKLRELQMKTRALKSRSEHLGPAFERLADSLEGVFKRAETDRFLCRSHLYS